MSRKKETVLQHPPPASGYNMQLVRILPCLLWALFITLSYCWNLKNNQEQHAATLLQAARSFFQQIEITREWNAGHGGVYVPVTETTAPNPYLKTPRRDIQVDPALMLTKINPAYMTRQISEIAKTHNNIQFHITSLDPIRPQNRADGREKEALLLFAQGKAKEIGRVIETGAGEAFFYMAPLITGKACLPCHQDQGYKEGDIRGGISVTLPFTPLPFSFPLAAGHLGLGLIGLGSILYLGVKLNRAYSTIKTQAIIDALTGIPNRRSFTERFLEEVNRHKRKQDPLSLLMCDLDNFKAYNDTYGHSAGDDCLLRTAQGIRDSLQRPGDFCARYGGEEFVIILPSTTANGALHVAQSIVANVRNLAIRHEKSLPEQYVTVSVGVATTSSGQADFHETLMQQADAALYQAKESGRNCVRVFQQAAAEEPSSPHPTSEHSTDEKS